MSAAQNTHNPIRIGIDGYNLAMPHGTGVATYGMVLARTLRAMEYQVEGVFGLDVGQDAVLREVMFFDRFARGQGMPGKKLKSALEFIASPLRRRAVTVPMEGAVEARTFRERLPHFDRVVSSPYLFEIAHKRYSLTRLFTTLTMDNPPDIMHWTYPVPIRLKGARNIYTLHDLVPLKLPFTTLDFKKTYFRIIRECIRSADHICTVSESSRNDIIARFGIAEGRITNTYQAALGAGAASVDLAGVDALAEERAIERVYGLKKDGYFLYFGAIEPKKNLGRLIEAHLGRNTKTPLVIVGSQGWQSDQELRLLPPKLGGGAMFQNKRASPVMRLGYLPRAMLEPLMRGSRAVLFPSLYEGFGLPVLEAMQAGAPVLTSDTSSLPEVGGDAALYVDPYDTGSIGAALERLDNDAELRETLRAGGREQAELFSMARYAERLRPVYEQVLPGE